ncbi:MAG: ribosomal protein L7/L12 [Anaerolineales bacterium]
MPQTFNCPRCGAPLDYDGGADPTIRCPFCNSVIIVPETLRTLAPEPGEASSASAADQMNALNKVALLARSGKKIEAIKLFRETFGVGLKEAKDAVEKIEAGDLAEVTRQTLNTPGFAGFATPSEPALDLGKLKEIGNLIRRGNKIEAIKLYRQMFGVGLKEAKDAVERLEAGQPVVMSNITIEAPGGTELAFPPSAPLIRPTPGVQKTSSPAAGCLGSLVVLLPLLGVLIGIAAIVLAALPEGLRISLSDFTRQVAGDDPVVLRFGGEGTGPGLFTDARTIAVDGEGHIYVGDYQDDRVQVFDSEGKFITQWMVETETPLTGMAADREGTVYVVQGGEIYRHDGANGEHLGKVEYVEGWGFEDVVVTADGALVASWYKNRDDIVRISRNGRDVLVIREAISSASGDSELSTRVAVDGLGNIYALGIFNNAVFKFTPEGRYLTRFGGDGDEPGQFRAPNAIAVDHQSRVYVSDIKGIQVFDSEGRYLKTIRVEGVAFGMAFNDQNELLVVSNTEQVIKFAISP